MGMGMGLSLGLRVVVGWEAPLILGRRRRRGSGWVKNEVWDAVAKGGRELGNLARRHCGGPARGHRSCCVGLLPQWPPQRASSSTSPTAATVRIDQLILHFSNGAMACGQDCEEQLQKKTTDT